MTIRETRDRINSAQEEVNKLKVLIAEFETELAEKKAASFYPHDLMAGCIIQDRGWVATKPSSISHAENAFAQGNWRASTVIAKLAVKRRAVVQKVKVLGCESGQFGIYFNVRDRFFSVRKCVETPLFEIYFMTADDAESCLIAHEREMFEIL